MYPIDLIAPVIPFTMALMLIIGPIGKSHKVPLSKKMPKIVDKILTIRFEKASFRVSGFWDFL